MMNFRNLGILAGLALSVSAAALNAYASEATIPPAPAGWLPRKHMHSAPRPRR